MYPAPILVRYFPIHIKRVSVD